MKRNSLYEDYILVFFNSLFYILRCEEFLRGTVLKKRMKSLQMCQQFKRSFVKIRSNNDITNRIQKSNVLFLHIN